MQVYSVAQITGYLRDILESDALLADVWISSEISNMSGSSAGHLYFTLKDEASQMRCVLFNRKRLSVDIENGLAVVAHGRISIYEVSGAVQLYVDMIQPTGLGVLNMEFERLKAKLAEEGLFEPSRKRPLPAFPEKIGIVTSPGGAVLHDITNIISRRYPVVELVLAPTTVQGESAVPGIINALNALNDRGDIDVIIIARGGGSIEDLWAFNDEKVARAIYSSKAPVISGVGHDTDFTIADFVADKRAPTPSAAAELAVPHRDEIETHIGSYIATMAASLSNSIERGRQHADELYATASNQVNNEISVNIERLRGQELKLDSLSPMATLERGYALVQSHANGEVISNISQVERGDMITVQVSDGQFNSRVTGSKKGLQAWMKDFPSNSH
ncbi:MAG: exodeoxyribonuclease VII large subunit [Dehalococcoidia bacterium]|jgi:exodeoxyribonuclease VII large subunit